MADKKREALERMKLLGLMPSIIADFNKTGRLYYSERTPLGGILYWVDNNPQWMKLVKEFEEEADALVYHCTHELFMDGNEHLTMLFVSTHEEEWEMDREDLANPDPDYGFTVFANVYNLTTGESEFGSVGMRPKAGGLIRTA